MVFFFTILLLKKNQINYFIFVKFCKLTWKIITIYFYWNSILGNLENSFLIVIFTYKIIKNVLICDI